MAKRNRYAQCALRRTIVDGSVTTTSWVPAEFAKLGRVLKLRNDHGQWTNGWIVESVGSQIVDTADVPDSRSAIRSHRRATGDSQPRLRK